MKAAYAALSRVELEQRLEAAERVCALFGWTAAHMRTDREKALHEVWRRWTEIAPSMSDSANWPELDDDAIYEMACARDAQRNITLRRIRGEQP